MTLTPYYDHDGITIYNADCREVLPLLLIGHDKSTRGANPKEQRSSWMESLVLTDPPYGISFVHGGRDNSGIGGGRYATKFAGVPVHGDNEEFDPSLLLMFPRCIIWGGNHFASRLPDASKWLVWDKRAASGHTNDFADCEIAWTNLGGVARVFRHHWDGMMRASERGVPRVHPTQKPLALMRWCLSLVPDAQTILDPFMGSGTTLLAAKRKGRSAVGIEIHERYCESAVKRLSQEVLF